MVSLIDLLKNEQPRCLAEKEQAAFEKLKSTIAFEPILKLPDFDILFKAHTNASSKAVGGVLVEEGHPATFES